MLQFDPISLAKRAPVPADVLALLDPVYDRFSQGFETADLKSANTLLDPLGHAQ